MTRFTLKCAVFLASISIFTSHVYGQGLKNTWGFGANVGLQQQHSAWFLTPRSLGGEAFVSRGLGQKTALNLTLGYAPTQFTPDAVNVGFINTPAGLVNGVGTTDLFFADLTLTQHLAKIGAVSPFIQGGVGAVAFSSNAWQGGARFFDAELILGGGLQVFATNNIAFQVSANAKLTTSDNLDAVSRPDEQTFTTGLAKTLPDAYITARAGLTFYISKKKTTLEKEIFTDDLTLEDPQEQEGDLLLGFEDEGQEEAVGEEGEEYQDFLARLNALDDGNTGDLTESGKTDVRNVNMEEYLRLKSRMDALSSAIEDRESEIMELQTDLGPADSPRRDMFSVSGPIEVTDFSNAYETGLSNFYSRRYANAISIFQKLLERYPNHSLASNCEYWIGESYFNQGEYLQSIQAFDRVVQYPNSLKKDDSVLMVGRAYLALNQKDQAEAAFTRLIREFPDSELVVKSEEYLRKL